MKTSRGLRNCWCYSHVIHFSIASINFQFRVFRSFFHSTAKSSADKTAVNEVSRPFHFNLSPGDEWRIFLFFLPSNFLQPSALDGTRGSAVNSSISRGTKSTGDKEKKIGHRRVGEDGEITYKKIQTSTIMGSIQLGIQHTVSDLRLVPHFLLPSICSTGRKLGLEAQTWLTDDGLLGDGDDLVSAGRFQHDAGASLQRIQI